jgi:hypothetical protein
MRLSQPQTLLKSVSLVVIYIIILDLPISLQFSSYYAIATTEHHRKLSASSITATNTTTKNIPPQKEDESIIMTKLLSKRKTTIIGAWDRYQMPLEEIQGANQKKGYKNTS